MTRTKTFIPYLFLAAGILAHFGAPRAGAEVSTCAITSDHAALKFLGQKMDASSTRFAQEYLYTGNTRTRPVTARVPVTADRNATPVPVAEFTQAAATKAAASRVPALAAPLEGVISRAKAAMGGEPKTAAKQEAAPKAGKSKDRNIFQKIGDWFSNAFSTVVGWVKSAVNWVGELIMGRSRHLTPQEEAEMRKIYGDKVDYSKVKIVDGSKKGLWGWILTSGGAAVTWGNRIYFPEGKYTFEKSPGWLAHEMGHHYQYKKDGWGYTVKSVWGQLTKGKSFYEYELEPGKKFGDYNVEQQAELIEHYYQIRNGTRSATPEEIAIYEQVMAGEGLF